MPGEAGRFAAERDFTPMMDSFEFNKIAGALPYCCIDDVRGSRLSILPFSDFVSDIARAKGSDGTSDAENAAEYQGSVLQTQPMDADPERRHELTNPVADK